MGERTKILWQICDGSGVARSKTTTWIVERVVTSLLYSSQSVTDVKKQYKQESIGCAMHES